MKNSITCFLVSITLTTASFGQYNDIYTPPCIKNAIKNQTRTEKGLPGDSHWQNRAEYKIQASLDPQSRLLSGSETINYYNNSPDSLRYLVIKLLQNLYKDGAARDYQIAPDLPNDGVVVQELAIDGNGLEMDNRRQVREYGTNMYVILGREMALPPGSMTEISIKWNYKVTDFYIRTGAYTDSSFFMGYWFPQIAVYDDINGWDNEQYTGLQEAYNDLADYDVELTLPSDYIVWASGDLVNSKDIFAEWVQERIDRSQKSDEVIKVLSAEDYESGNILRHSGDNTWHFKAEKVPDFAWAVSSYYLWDAKSVVVDKSSGRRTWVNTAYPPTATGFKKAIEWASRCIEYFSEEFPGIPFPYNKHVSFNGQEHAAMEWPMIANDCDSEHEEYLAEIVAHEIAHNYIPFFILSNERLFAWMDEGMIKLMGEKFTELYGNKRENFERLNTTQMYTGYAGTIYDVPLLTASSSIDTRFNFHHSYAKAVAANVFLLEMLEEKGIEKPFREYFERWKGKHPTPWDFFNTMNEIAGEDLGWYWNAWYMQLGYPDLAPGEVGFDSKAGETFITVNNKGKLPVPVIAEITGADGKKEVYRFTAEVWKDNPEQFRIKLPGNVQIGEVIIGDPHVMDIFPEDNRWKAESL